MLQWIAVVVEYSIVLAFLGWCLWATNPKHPERLNELRRKFGVR